MTATLTVDTGQLKSAVEWARPDPGNPVPVLANVRVLIAGGQLIVACYDWETCKIGRVPGTGDGGSGSMLAGWKQLMAAVRVHGNRKRTEVTVDGGDLRVGQDTARVDLVASNQRVTVVQTADPAAYPALPSVFPPPSGWCDAQLLAPALTQAAGCCSDDRTLPVTRAVHFVPGPGVLALEATDRYVLGLHQVPVTYSGAPPGPWLFPGALAAEFARSCDETGPVFISAPGPEDPARLTMLSDGWHTLLTRAGAGEYLNVSTLTARPPVIKATFTADAAVLAGVLAESAVLAGQSCTVKLAALLADDTDPRKPADKKAWVAERAGCGTFLDAGPAGAEVVCADPFTRAELGRWTVTEDPAAGDAVVQLNPGHLTRLLPAAGGLVTVALAAASVASRVTWDGDPAWRGLIMPVRTEVFPVRVLNAKEEVNA
jgi:hypothetical protein